MRLAGFRSVILVVLIAPTAGWCSNVPLCNPLFIKARSLLTPAVKTSNGREQMQNAWVKNFSDPVVKEFWTALADKSYEGRFTYLTRPSYRGSVEALDQIFEMLDEKIRKATFLRLSRLLLTYELLPNDHDSVFGAEEVKDLITVLHLRSKDLDLTVSEVKGLLILVLDRWKSARTLDANYNLKEEIDGRKPSDAPPAWIRSKAWGKNGIRLKDVHDSPDLRIATLKTFNFHLKDQALTDEALKEAFTRTLQGSDLSGENFVAIVRSLVLDASFYTDRVYYSGTSGVVADLQTLANILRQAAKQVVLSTKQVDQIQILLRRFSLGLLLARDFAQSLRQASRFDIVTTLTDYLRGFPLEGEDHLQELKIRLAPLRAKKSPELPEDLDQAVAALFSRQWGQRKAP